MTVTVPPKRLTAMQARLLHLHAQGLLKPPRRRARRADVLAAVQRMQLLQIDTINVVARSPYLVLHSRLGDYRAEWLDELLAEGGLFEVWAHEACFAPTADFDLHRGALPTRSHWSLRSARRQAINDRDKLDGLLDHVRSHGAVRSADFAGGGARTSPWWGWKDEKRWLEACFALGELMVARRDRFQRVYDLPERVIGRRRDDHKVIAMTPEQSRRDIILRSVRALGIAQRRWIADYYRIVPGVTEDELAALAEQGLLLRVAVDGWSAPGWLHRDNADALSLACAGRLRASHRCLLSPFDPVVWDRERALAMFGFDYRLECYTPAGKRRYGYFTLPVLRRGRLIGRLDAKAHRTDRVFEVKALHLEDGIAIDDGLVVDVAQAISDSARWHDTPQIRILDCNPRVLQAPLRRAVSVIADGRG